MSWKTIFLYYIAAFTVKSLLWKLVCVHSKDKLLLDVQDDMVFQMVTDTRLVTSFTCCVNNCKGYKNGIQAEGIRWRKCDQLQAETRSENTISSSWASWATDLQAH